MRRIFLTLLLAFVVIYSNAQQQDRFSDYTQLKNNSVVLYDLQSLTLTKGKFVYQQIEGKLKAIQPKIIAEWGNALELNCIDIIEVKNKKYIYCVHQEYGKLFLLINKKKNDYINNFRSLTYWNSILDQKKGEYSYLYDEKASINRLIDRYSKVHWSYAQLPLTNIEDEAEFHYTTGNSGEANIISYSDFLNNSGNIFRSEEEYERNVVEQHKLDSIQEVKDKIKDKIVLAAECCVDRYDYGSGENDYMSKGDTVFIYYAEDSYMKGWYRHKDLKIYNNILRPLDNEQYKFIKYRGYKNIDYRDSIAREESNKYFNRVLLRLVKKVNEEWAKIQAEEKEIRTKQLFLKDLDYVYGEYSDFGLEFEIHNCWRKTIKYIEFTTTAYNAVGDVQRDWVGKYSSKTKGIGPLKPGETATWSFDDMFYDKNDVIRRVKLTKITFIFTDGTSKTFTGSTNINKHRW